MSNQKELIYTLQSKNWVGVLKFQSKNKYPLNPRGIPQFLWIPLDSKNCPQFLVSSNQFKKYNQPQYVLIQYKEWPSSSARPIGLVISYLGEVGVQEAEILARLHYYNFNINKFKIKNLLPNDSNSNFNSNTHQDYTHLPVYTIDPKGCQDIDDGFSYQSDKRILGIHIADVLYYLKQYQILPSLIEKKRYSSIYLPDKIIHMLPENISTQMASLLPNENKLAWTLWICLSDDYNIEKWSWERTIIKSRKAYSYEEADKCEIIQNISQIIRMIGQNKLNYQKPEWTTHEMIEILMILANNLFAIDIQKHFQYGIFRIHQQKISEENNSNHLNHLDYDPELSKFLSILQTEAAEYTWDNGNYYHFGLSLNKYTHFTSPIRRLVDIYNHLLLEELIYGNKDPLFKPWDINLDDINSFNKDIKKFQRDLDKIQLIETLKKYKKGHIINGYIIGSSPYYQIYIPDKKLLINNRLWADEINHLIQAEDNEKDIIINKKTIIPKYQQIPLTFFINPLAMRLDDKINIEINILKDYITNVLIK